MRRTFRICLITALALALFGAYAEALPAGLGFSLPLNAQKVIPPSGVIVGLELYRPLPDGTLRGPIAMWVSTQPNVPTVINTMAVRAKVLAAANSVEDIKISADKYGAEVATKDKKERRAAERAQYATLQPEVGWVRDLPSPLPLGILGLDVTVWSKDEMNEYTVGRRSQERKTFGQSIAFVQRAPEDWDSYDDDTLVRFCMTGWTSVQARVNPGWQAEQAAYAAMQAQLAAANQGMQKPAPSSAAPKPSPSSDAPVLGPQKVWGWIYLMNGDHLDRIPVLAPLEKIDSVRKGTVLAFKVQDQTLATAVVSDPPKGYQVTSGTIFATMKTGVGKNVSHTTVQIKGKGESR